MFDARLRALKGIETYALCTGEEQCWLLIQSLDISYPFPPQPYKARFMHKIKLDIIFSPHVVIRRSSRLIELALLVLVRVRVLRVGISLATLLAANRMI